MQAIKPPARQFHPSTPRITKLFPAKDPELSGPHKGETAFDTQNWTRAAVFRKWRVRVYYAWGNHGRVRNAPGTDAWPALLIHRKFIVPGRQLNRAPAHARDILRDSLLGSVDFMSVSGHRDGLMTWNWNWIERIRQTLWSCEPAQVWLRGIFK